MGLAWFDGPTRILTPVFVKCLGRFSYPGNRYNLWFAYENVQSPALDHPPRIIRLFGQQRQFTHNGDDVRFASTATGVEDRDDAVKEVAGET